MYSSHLCDRSAKPVRGRGDGARGLLALVPGLLRGIRVEDAGTNRTLAICRRVRRRIWRLGMPLTKPERFT
jgi:hypothetical protein